VKRVHIDFAASSLARSIHRTHATVWLLALCAFVLTVGASVLGWQLHSSQRADQRQLAALQVAPQSRAGSTRTAPLVLVANKIPEAQAAAVNNAVLQLNLPWRDLQDAMSAATPKQIALLALEPDARKHSIKITAEARASDDMIAYIEKLKQQPLFVDVSLSRHEINELDPNKPIRFQIDAAWSAP
jgi:Tfp pilus assembly protein PilN